MPTVEMFIGAESDRQLSCQTCSIVHLFESKVFIELNLDVEINEN